MTSETENIVPLTDSIMANGSSSSVELEKKRHIVIRALQIAMKQLEGDAGRMEQEAILAEIPMMRRHEMFALARSLRTAQSWLDAIVNPEQPKS